MNGSVGRNWRPVLVAALAATVVAAAGAWITELGPWYYGLRLPAWKPPDWLFGPAWTLIFTLTAIAGVRAWRDARDSRMRRRLLALFTLNAILNIAWSVLFFRLERPDWALKEVVLLWGSIVLLMILLWSQRRGTAALLLPYLVWVTFAGVLNAWVVQLNGPFGR